MLRAPLFHAVLWTSILMIGFSIPGMGLHHHAVLSPDKFAHFGGFMILAILWLRVYPTSVGRIIVYSALFAVLSEVYQHVMPINRMFDTADILADLGGLLVGVRISRPLARLKKSRESEQL
ncbi:MAG: VanZ family protein [Bacteroidetes bacterium]|nr:VanZ family protein [Bacteroidota bacterium]MCH8031791.1 VanZ family protein [Bacteroidota bacterium]